jgi:hypothetical protein
MMDDAIQTRRTFNSQVLGSLLTYSLLEMLCQRELFADEIRPEVVRWLADVNQLGLDCQGQKLEQIAWQKKVEELMARVSMPDLLSLLDFDRMQAGVSYADRGERSLKVNFPKVDGLPTELSFGKQIFALKKDRSVVPHGHNNMATAFLILKGDLHGRHYERVRDEGSGRQPTHMIIHPTIDRQFGPGECSTVSDFKDNVHWFQALTEPAFIFNLHVYGVNPASKLPTTRVYIDPKGEPIDGGLTRARVIGYKEAIELYG